MMSALHILCIFSKAEPFEFVIANTNADRFPMRLVRLSLRASSRDRSASFCVCFELASVYTNMLVCAPSVAGKAEIYNIQLLPQRHRQQGRQGQKYHSFYQDIRRDWHSRNPSSLKPGQFPKPEATGVDTPQSLATP